MQTDSTFRLCRSESHTEQTFHIFPQNGCGLWPSASSRPLPGGGRVLGLEKGTNCGPSAAELWLSRANNAKKRGDCPVIKDDYRELSNMFILGFYIKLQLYACKVVQETLRNKLFGKTKSNKH